ncbi:MAG: hypothetical protein IPM69_00450 [Ignavibacteria bacterium]|nr:hypothetical protein [Ignavibacteria bacterium]
MKQINDELLTAKIAIDNGNEGKARVCARRAVQIILQSKIGVSNGYTFSAMSALQYLIDSTEYPEIIRQAAGRLKGGLRAKLEGNVFSENPIEDAEIIIRYFG